MQPHARAWGGRRALHAPSAAARLAGRLEFGRDGSLVLTSAHTNAHTNQPAPEGSLLCKPVKAQG